MDIVEEIEAELQHARSGLVHNEFGDLLERAAKEITLLRKIIVAGCDDRPEPPIPLTVGEWGVVQALKQQALKEYERR